MLRSVYGKPLTVHTAELYISTKAITVDMRVKLTLAVFVHGILFKSCPLNWYDYFRISDLTGGRTSRRLRQQGVVMTRAPALVSGSIQRRAITLWNSFGVDIRTSLTKTELKAKLRDYYVLEMRRIYTDGESDTDAT